MQILKDIAASGAYIFPWESLRRLLATRLAQVAAAYYVEERRQFHNGDYMRSLAEYRTCVTKTGDGSPSMGEYHNHYGSPDGYMSLGKVEQAVLRALTESMDSFSNRLANLVAMILDPSRLA